MKPPPYAAAAMPAQISGIDSKRRVIALVAARTRDIRIIVATVERAAPATAAVMRAGFF